jgi:hypothetical protein
MKRFLIEREVVILELIEVYADDEKGALEELEYGNYFLRDSRVTDVIGEPRILKQEADYGRNN